MPRTEQKGLVVNAMRLQGDWIAPNRWDLLRELPRMVLAFLIAIFLGLIRPRWSNYSIDFLPVEEWGFGEYIPPLFLNSCRRVDGSVYGVEGDVYEPLRTPKSSRKYGFFSVDFC